MKLKNSLREKLTNLAINEGIGHDQGVVKGLSNDGKILESPRKSLSNDESSRTMMKVPRTSLINVESASNNAEQARTMMKVPRTSRTMMKAPRISRTMMKVPRTMLNKKGCWEIPGRGDGVGLW